MEDENSMGGIIAGAAALGASAINAGSQERTNRWQMKLAEYAYQQEREMIREQNLYNSPAQQLERYKEAGLNPNLIYGEGKASAGNQSGIASYKAPSLTAPQVGTLGVTEAIGAMLNLKQMELNTQKTSAEVEAMRYRNQLTERYIRRQDSELSYYDLLHADGKDSPAFQDYSAGIRLKNQQLELGELEKGYRALVNEGQKLNNAERRYFNNFLLPLSLEAKKLEIEGMSYENIKRKIDSELWRDLRTTEMQSNPLRAASHLGILFGRSPLGVAWKESLRKAAEVGKRSLKRAFRIK